MTATPSNNNKKRWLGNATPDNLAHLKQRSVAIPEAPNKDLHNPQLPRSARPWLLQYHHGHLRLHLPSVVPDPEQQPMGFSW